jgi:GH24 family phage-related lysozyme (muramidase)
MKYNRSDYDGAADEFLKWRKANGVVLRGLERRREAERALFLSGG